MSKMNTPFRVGIVASQLTNNSGGSFTYQNEIINALIQPFVTTKIEWVVISTQRSAFKNPDFSSRNIQYFDFSFSVFDHKYGLCVNWLTSHIKSLVSGTRFKLKIERRSEYFAKKLKNLNLEMIWYLDAFPHTQEIPYILSVWDIENRNQPWFPEVSINGIWSTIELWRSCHFRRASYLINGNNVGAEEISRTYSVPLSRIIVNPLPVPTDAINYATNNNTTEEILTLRKDLGEFILYPAQFWAHKNHKILLEAIAHLAEKSQPFPKLVLTGSDKGNLAYIRMLIDKLNISKYVLILGFVNRSDLLYLYSEALCLTFPSFFGPDNIPPLEAMALGCPVLVGDSTGMREQLGSAAIYLSHNNAQDWAIAITNLTNNPALRKELSELGRLKIQSYTMKEYLKRVTNQILEFKEIRRTWDINVD